MFREVPMELVQLWSEIALAGLEMGKAAACLRGISGGPEKPTTHTSGNT